MRTKYKPWAKPYIEEHTDYSLTDEEISSLEDFYLEIGSGKGDFIYKMSTKFPTRQFLAIEKNVTCAGIALKRLVENEVKNVKLLWRDGEEVVHLVKDHSVNIIYLNFSDPWPKKRHSKRRLTYGNFLKEYQRILKKDGLLIFKTDNSDLFTYSLESFQEAGFNNVVIDRDYDGLDPDDAPTEYELRFRALGTPIKRVVIKND